jgi:hypothetical protein
MEYSLFWQYNICNVAFAMPFFKIAKFKASNKILQFKKISKNVRIKIQSLFDDFFVVVVVEFIKTYFGRQ